MVVHHRPSGSGKSTLLNLVGGSIARLGQVSVDGEALAGLGDDQLTRCRRDKIGFIFQFFNLLPTLSSLENVGLPLHLRGWPRKKVDERARELLSLVQLEPRCTSPRRALRRRAPARRHRPRAVGLSADPARRRTDRQPRHPHRRRDPRRSSAISTAASVDVVIVTHDMNVAQSCERTIALRDGRIVEDVATRAALRSMICCA
jgi:putative ABC transport system ATP-binding protein